MFWRISEAERAEWEGVMEGKNQYFDCVYTIWTQIKGEGKIHPCSLL
jgi:hypothetical protein